MYAVIPFSQFTWISFDNVKLHYGEDKHFNSPVQSTNGGGEQSTEAISTGAKPNVLMGRPRIITVNGVINL